MQTIVKMSLLVIGIIASAHFGLAQEEDVQVASPAEQHASTSFMVSVANKADNASRTASGFIVNSQGYVLTSASLIGRDDDDTWFVQVSGTVGVIPATVISLNEDLGVALLKTNDVELPNVATFASFDLEKGAPVQSLSMDGDGTVAVSPGSIGDAALPTRNNPPVQYFVHNALVTAEGYGGALLNRCGEVVGINVTNPNLSRRSARRLPALDQSVYSLTLDPTAQFLFASDIDLSVAPGRCLSAEEETIEAVSVTKSTEEELGEAQRKLDELEVARQEAEAERQERQDEADRLRAEADRLKQDNEASEAEIDDADAAAAEAESLAEQASLKLSDLQTEIDTLDGRIKDLENRLKDAQRRLYYVLAGSAALLILLGLGLSIIIRNRGSKLVNVSADLDAAHEKLAETFPDVECRGKDGQNAPHAFRVSGAALVRSPEGLVIGRQPASADIVLNHPEVSRDHARVQIKDGELTIEDLGSTNGTFVDGVKLEKGNPRRLQDGSELKLGQITLTAKYIGA